MMIFVIAALTVSFLIGRLALSFRARRRAKLGLAGQHPDFMGPPISSPFDRLLPLNPSYATREEQIVFEVARALLKLLWIFIKWVVIASIGGTLLVAAVIAVLQLS